MTSKEIDKQQELHCQRCLHTWEYRGQNPYFALCPHCRRTVRIRKKESRHVVQPVQIDAHIQADTATQPSALRSGVWRMSTNTYQKIPIGGHNTSYGYHNGIKEDNNKCCAKGCTILGRLLLKINYIINKTGYLCDSCAQDLLQQALAVEIEGVSDQKKMVVLMEKDKEKAPSKKLKEKLYACVSSFRKVGTAVKEALE